MQTAISLMPSPPSGVPSQPPEAFRLPDPDGREYLPQAYRLPEGEVRGSVTHHAPQVVFIEVTNHCNLLCETCPRTFVTYEEPKTLSWEDFLRIVAQFPDMQRAVLHGIGEPLLNQDLPRMIEFLKARGVTVLFNTNATLLTEAWGRALIARGLDEMRCSIDGAQPETYARIRGAPVLHKIVRNLKRFMELQRELNADRPRVSIWMTGMRENIAELPDLVRLAAYVGVPEVYVQRMVYYLDSDQPPGMMDAGHSLFDDFNETVDRIIAEAEALAGELGITLRASGATDPRRSLAASQRGDLRPWAACLRPWTTAYVTANGNCLPCCISPFATTDYDSLKMGNLFEQEFSAIWNDERYQRWRTELLSAYPPTPCQGCGMHWSL
jgi:radical SAM protein with 4Fe4S-binding SPASM domain